MLGVSSLAIATLASVLGQSLAVPITINPSTKGDGSIQIARNNEADKTGITQLGHELTNRGTATATGSLSNLQTRQGPESLKINLQNNFGGGDLQVYVTGVSNGAVVMLSTDGTWYHPDAQGSTSGVEINGNIAIKLNGQGQSTEITLPDYLESGRVWIAQGDLKFHALVDGAGQTQIVQPSPAKSDDPSANVNWGFVELTNLQGQGIYANISYVDWVGLVLGMSLTNKSGDKQTALGLQPNAVASICQDLTAQAAQDGQPWDQMCIKGQDGTPLRILSPNIFHDINPTTQVDYYSDYIEKVWARFANGGLSIDTQSEAGTVACQTSGDLLTCEGDNRGYAKPTIQDIWGCNTGAFAIAGDDNAVHKAVVPRLCAAFTRSTLLLEGGEKQPGVGRDSYYTTNPTNWYSKIVHKYEVDGKGYAFSYDDVNPEDQNESGVVSDANPDTLEIIIGGPSA